MGVFHTNNLITWISIVFMADFNNLILIFLLHCGWLAELPHINTHFNRNETFVIESYFVIFQWSLDFVLKWSSRYITFFSFFIGNYNQSYTVFAIFLCLAYFMYLCLVNTICRYIFTVNIKMYKNVHICLYFSKEFCINLMLFKNQDENCLSLFMMLLRILKFSAREQSNL